VRGLVNIEFSVRLPVDAKSVPLVRGLLRQTLEHLDVSSAGVDEILLALTEACANVVQHAGEDEYRVDVSIDDELCRISVLDHGGGFDVEAVTAAPPPSPLDGGRGLLLMRQLVDRLSFVADETGTHRVTLEKRLSPRSALRLLESS
jgi:anti-sigma regulatory factor (Ser/Thr protein kinase)